MKVKKDKPLFIVEKTVVDKTMFLKEGGCIDVSRGHGSNGMYNLHVPYGVGSSGKTVTEAAEKSYKEMIATKGKAQDSVRELKEKLKNANRYLKEITAVCDELREYLE